MKCPICDHPTNYRSPARFVNHLHRKHKVEETAAFQIWCNILQVCHHCDAVIPASCVGCISCGKQVKDS